MKVAPTGQTWVQGESAQWLHSLGTKKYLPSSWGAEEKPSSPPALWATAGNPSLPPSGEITSGLSMCQSLTW